MKLGADPNFEVRGRPAIISENFNVTKLLLELGANVNHIFPRGHTLLMKECKQGSIDNIKALLELGADPNIVTIIEQDDGHHNVSSLLNLLMRRDNTINKVEGVKLLIKYGVKDLKLEILPEYMMTTAQVLCSDYYVIFGKDLDTTLLKLLFTLKSKNPLNYIQESKNIEEILNLYIECGGRDLYNFPFDNEKNTYGN